MRGTEPIYTLNLAAILPFVFGVAVILGALGGDEFQRGAASLLVLNAGAVFDLSFSSNAGWLKWIVLPMVPVTMGLYAVAVIVMLMGLS